MSSTRMTTLAGVGWAGAFVFSFLSFLVKNNANIIILVSISNY